MVGSFQKIDLRRDTYVAWKQRGIQKKSAVFAAKNPNVMSFFRVLSIIDL